MRYQHYKGGVYDLICEARLEADPKQIMIIYRAEDGSIWARPSEVFFGVVEVDGETVTRFTPI